MRAAAFHAGALRRLAESNQLENVVGISSVSGGSLLVGLIFHFADYQWPSSSIYLSEVFPKIRKVLCETSLQWDALKRLVIYPRNWRFVFSRAAVVAESIERLWKIDAIIDQLPKVPVWSINGTTAENGRRFRFKRTSGGDYELGYADFSGFKLAHAMAMSAAFPGGIGPLPIFSSKYKWEKREAWDLASPLKSITLPFSKLHLYDGGIYDNLGTEPFFDSGTQQLKATDEAVDYLIVCDAGRPYSRATIPGPLHPGRFKRLADVAMDQTRSLRIRSFSNFLKKQKFSGMYLQIGSDPTKSLQAYAKYTGKSVPDTWLSEDAIKGAAGYKTNLVRLSPANFDSIARHGHETTSWNIIAFASEMFDVQK